MGQRLFQHLRSAYLPWLLCLTSVCVAILFFVALRGPGYFPAQEDETTLYNTARLFVETGSVKAASTCNEEVSRLLGANWYGVFYGLFYGPIFKITGFTASYFIWINLFLVVSTIIIVGASSIPARDKLFIPLLLLSLYSVTNYAFTIYPEILHLFFSVVLSMTLVAADRDYASDGRFGKFRLRYILLVLLFTLFRPTFVFWLSGLLAYSKSRRAFFGHLLLFGAAVFLTLVYMRYFTAPLWIQGGRIIDELVQFHFGTFAVRALSSFLHNLKALVFACDPAIYTTFVLTASAWALAWTTRSRLVLASALVSSICIAVMTAFYVPWPFSYNKQTAFLVPLLIVGMVSQSNARANLFLLLLFLSQFPFSVINARKLIHERKKTYREYHGKYSDRAAAFNELRTAVDQGKDNTILWLYDEHGIPNNCSDAYVPLTAQSGRTIFYTTNVIRNPSAPDSVKFRFHHKLRIDYVLSRRPVVLPGLTLDHQTLFYHLYRITPSTGP